MDLNIIWESHLKNEEEEQTLEGCLKRGIEATLSLARRETGDFVAQTPDFEVGLVLTNDQAIQILNRQFRGIDSPTDVLSFALRESGAEEGMAIAFDHEEQVLGDIIISLESAARQAKEYGHSLAREAVFLAIHGTLHLLGFDHVEEEDYQEMNRWEETLMGQFRDL